MLQGSLVRNNIIIAMTAIGLNAIVALFSDSTSAIQHHYQIFLATKLTVIITCIVCIILSIRHKYLAICQELVPITAIFYMCSGEIFAPGYNLAYTQLMMFIPLILRMPFIRIMSYIAASFVLFIISVCLGSTPDTTVANYPNYFSDIVVSICTSTLLGAFLAAFVKRNEAKLENLKNKYTNFGLNASVIIHDLKNNLMAPYRHLSTMKDSPDAEKAVTAIEESVSKLQEILAFHEEDQRCRLEDVVKDIIRVMELSSRGITVKEIGIGDFIPCSERDIRSVVTNIFTNSIYMSELKNIELQITVKYQKRGVIIEDNGVGYPQKAIRNFQNYIPFSERTLGNGIGLINSRLLIETCGGKMSIYNHPGGGAATEIKFLS